MDIVRALLESIEKDDRALVTGIDQIELTYHAELLIEAGFMKGSVSYGQDRGRRFPNQYFVQRLTWEGHEFLDASRNSKIWEMAKEHLLKPGSSWTFSLLLEYLKAQAAKQIGLSL